MKRYVFVLLAVLMNSDPCPAREAVTSSIGVNDDCTRISVDFKDNPNLTRQEKEALMDQALRDSLNRYDRCQNAHTRADTNGGEGGSNGIAGGEAGTESGTGGKNTGQGNSTASTNMTGTNITVETTTALEENQTGKNQTKNNRTSVSHTAVQQTRGQHVPGNGKIPDDIPPADNDSVLEEQIRQAAINETNPAIKAKLWDEYRRYKGLPARHKPQGQ